MSEVKNDWFAETLRHYHRKADKQYKSEMCIEKPRTCYLSIRDFSIFEFYSVEGLAWFRVFGVGLHSKDTSTRTMDFSERNGYWKSVRLGRWFIKFLPYRKTAKIKYLDPLIDSQKEEIYGGKIEYVTLKEIFEKYGDMLTK